MTIGSYLSLISAHFSKDIDKPQKSRTKRKRIGTKKKPAPAGYVILAPIYICRSKTTWPLSPGPGVAIFGLCIVENVLFGPVGGLLPTEEQLDLVGSESLELLHGKYPVKATWRRGGGGGRHKEEEGNYLSFLHITSRELD